MNILQLTDYLPDYPGNFGNMLISMCVHNLNEGGLTIISFPTKRNWHNEILNNGGKVIYSKVYKFKDKIVDFKSIIKYNKVIRENNIKLVHVHFGLSQKIVTIFLKVLNPRLRVIWHWRGDIDDEIKGSRRQLIFLFYRYFSSPFVFAHIANSSNIHQRMLSNNLVDAKKLHVMQNAIDVKLFKKDLYINENKLRFIEYEAEKYFNIIMIRNFRPRVDFNVIFDAMGHLLKLAPEIRLLWIGYGENENNIRNIILNRGLNNIKLIGKVSNPIPYYLISKVNIIAWEPWCNETINNTAYEALMCEIPVVGLNFGGLPKSFSEGEGVYTVPVDGLTYAETIIKIKDNYNDVLKKVMKGKEKVLNQNTNEIYIKRLFKIYGVHAI